MNIAVLVKDKASTFLCPVNGRPYFGHKYYWQIVNIAA